MQILVTGGAGFIGSHIVHRLIEDGHEVAIIDNLSSGFMENVPPGARLYKVDICNAGALEQVFHEEKPQIISHHAAQSRVRNSVLLPESDAAVNIIGSINLLKLAVQHDVKYVLYASSGGAVYGEPASLPVTEDSPINPVSPYGISKHTVEHYFSLFHQLFKLNYIILRYPNVYGPRQDAYGEAGVCAIFIRQMLTKEVPVVFGDGKQIRDYVYIEDIVNAHQLAMENELQGIYNIGSGIGTSVNRLIEIFRKATGYAGPIESAPPRTGDILRIVLDASRFRTATGWNPLISLETGIANTANWFKSYLKDSYQHR